MPNPCLNCRGILHRARHPLSPALPDSSPGRGSGGGSPTYYAGYVGLGAAIGFEHAILLATVTIMTSVVVFIPMGLGVLDALWVYAATRAGLSLADSVALAILLRTSYLSAAVFVAALLSVLPRVR